VKTWLLLFELHWSNFSRSRSACYNLGLYQPINTDGYSVTGLEAQSLHTDLVGAS